MSDPAPAEAEPSEPPGADPAKRSGRSAYLIAQAKAVPVRAAATRGRLEAARGRHRSLDIVFDTAERDSRVGGSLLAGALAFRLFLWLLPAALLLVAGLGFGVQGYRPGSTADGLSEFLASIIDQASRDANRSRWVALVLGLGFLFIASRALITAVVAATAFAWQVPVPLLASKARSAVATSGVLFVALAGAAGATWLRDRSPGPGLTLMIALMVPWTLLWWAIALRLPRPPDLTARDLLPGAVLVGAGMEAMHLAAALYLNRRIGSASELYGGLGAAATLLLAAYLIARLIVGSCALSASVASRRARDREPAAG